MPSQKEQEQSILQEIQKYKKDCSYAKPLFQSMQEISAWLNTKEK